MTYALLGLVLMVLVCRKSLADFDGMLSGEEPYVSKNTLEVGSD